MTTRETPRPSCLDSENLPSELADGTPGGIGVVDATGRDASGFVTSSGISRETLVATGAESVGAGNDDTSGRRGSSAIAGFGVASAERVGPVRLPGAPALKSMTILNGLYSVKTL